ncbi:MAG: glycosyltransferase [Kofleriaceae bacterium]|nr:glycosyltransferase [Kofleriaceae bacterium]MCB9572881.1 glycosyltransferase [Kofleriaceae bacterium]
MAPPSTAPGAARAAVVDVVVAARDDAATLADVLAGLPHRRIRTVVVVDNGSRDATSQLARDAGVVVLRQPRGGHGAACLHAIAHLGQLPQPPDVVVFVPGDGSIDPAAVLDVLAPIEDDGAELVIGVGERGRAADRVVNRLIGAVYRYRFAGVGRIRAIRYPALVALGMSDRGGGWDVEMQVRAIKIGLAIAEVEVDGRPAPRGHGARAVADGAAARGRSLLHILRHATMR